MSEKPWQWLIDEITNDIEFCTKHGLDKENPVSFSKKQETLELLKKQQARDVRNIGMRDKVEIQ